MTVDSVNLYLEILEFSSNKTSPIIVNSKLNDIKIISIENVILNDYEDSSKATAECAIIKIKKKSKVTFQNKKDFKLNGEYKNIIKGGAQATIIFPSSNGEYIIIGNKTAIASDGLLKFNGGKFNITTKTGAPRRLYNILKGWWITCWISLLIGQKDSIIGPNINILYSYEAIEGMSIRIYSGKIKATATDDGLNAAGGISNDEKPSPPHLLGEGPNLGPSGGGNSSYFISIYGGEINVFVMEMD